LGNAMSRWARPLCGGALFLSYIYTSILDIESDSAEHMLHDARVEAFQVLGWLIGLTLLARLPRRRISAVSWAVLLAVALVGSVNVSVGLAAFAALLYWPGENSAGHRRAGAVFVALLIQFAVAPFLFEFCAPYVIRFETMLVGPLVAATVSGATWAIDTISLPNGHAVQINDWCSSFHNVSLAGLAWVALTRLERPDWRRGDLLVLAVVSGLQIFLNTIRIYLMAMSYEMYLYWHTGTGSHIFSITASVLTVLICVEGARYVARDREAQPRALAAEAAE
jgi:exosortase/archaeosortase family protein